MYWGGNFCESMLLKCGQNNNVLSQEAILMLWLKHNEISREVLLDGSVDI